MLVRDGSIEVETPTGPMRTYVYEPAQPGRPEDRVPGVVLYSEIFQQTPPIRRLAVQIAGHGYLVMVPEVYHSRLPPGTVLGYDDEGLDQRYDAVRGELECTKPVSVGGHLSSLQGSDEAVQQIASAAMTRHQSH